MKMLVLAPHPFFTPRGTPFSVYYRTLVTAEKNVKIDLLTYHPGLDVDIDGVRIVRIPRVAFLEPVPVGPSAKKLLLDVLMILWTIGLLIRYRYDVVHAHEEAVFWARVLKVIFRFRLIYDMHSSLPQQLENFGFTKSRVIIGIFTFLENSCLRAADAVITICPDLRDYVLSQGIPAERHFLIENSIFDDVRIKKGQRNETHALPSTIDLKLPDNVPTVVYAGTFEAYQGIDILIGSFSKVVQRTPAYLILAGGTDDQIEEFRKLADSVAITEHCVFTGRVSKTVALELTRSADILVSPRVRGTNTPLKIYEQLASGKPLVATNIYSHTQVLDESVCYLVEPNVDSMAEGLAGALSNSLESSQRSENARVLYDRDYSRPVYEAKIEKLLALVS